MPQKKRATTTLRHLKIAYPKSKIALKFGNNIQLLVAVILSAQCTDKKVNEVTEKIFSTKGGSASGGKKYWSVEDFANAKQGVLEREIHSTGFFRAKAKNIIGAARMIQNDFGGELPRTMLEMIHIPGVARKTANIVLGNAYGVVEGIAVDTHVKRFARVCGFSDSDNPVKIEQDLMKLFPKKEWLTLTYRIIDHGRDSRKKEHKHEPCALRDICGDPKF